MADPFVAEIRMFPFNFAPKGWAWCDGQLLPLSQNTALFSLLGTTYGGDGRVNFGLPNLQGRVPIHVGSGHTLGERGGEPAHTLSIAEIPTHTHIANSTGAVATTNNPTSALQTAQSTSANLYAPAANFVAMNPGAIGITGGSQAHLNLMPFLTLSMCIALQGIFPSPN